MASPGEAIPAQAKATSPIEGLFDEQITIQEWATATALMLTPGTNPLFTAARWLPATRRHQRRWKLHGGDEWQVSSDHHVGAQMRLQAFTDTGAFIRIRERDSSFTLR